MNTNAAATDTADDEITAAATEKPSINIPVTDLMKAMRQAQFMQGLFNPSAASSHRSRVEAIQTNNAKARQSAKLSRQTHAARRLERGWN